MKKFAFAATAAAVLLAACATGGTPSGSDYAPAAPMATKPMTSAAGAEPLAMREGMLVNSHGLTVYVFDKDVAGSGKSVCNGDCAVKWPPVLANPGDTAHGAYTIVVREDGRRQWAYQGRPVYTWPEDQEPGDKYGDNKFNIWHVVKQ
jgi:predicted lipoprotein with Yx(FWY)xxD motif